MLFRSRLLEELYKYYKQHIDQLPEEYLEKESMNDEPHYQAVVDYIAGMTDRFAVAKFKELMIPVSWDVY